MHWVTSELVSPGSTASKTSSARAEKTASGWAHSGGFGSWFGFLARDLPSATGREFEARQPESAIAQPEAEPGASRTAHLVKS